MEFERHLMERDREEYLAKEEDLGIPVDGEEIVAASYVAQFASNYTMQTLFGLDAALEDGEFEAAIQGHDYFQMTEEEIEEEYQAYLKKMADIDTSKKDLSKTKFTDLPYDILLHITTILPWKSKLALYNTSNLTRSIILDPLVWQEIDCQKVACSHENIKILEQVLESILPQGIGSSLKYLHLGLFHLYLKENILVNVLERSPNLETVCVPAAIKVTKEEVEAIFTNCKKLQTLELPDCRVLSDDLISKFHCLVKLDISAIQGYNSVTDVGVESIVTNCKDLSWINLSGCHALTDGSLRAIAKGLKDLQYLAVIGCFEITSRGVHEVLKRQRKLRYLDISFCWQIDDYIFKEYEEGSELCLTQCISTLLIQGCSQLSDAGLESLADLQPKQLSYLNISYCTGLTDRSLRAVQRIKESGDGKLQKFVYEECSNIRLSIQQ